MSKPPTERQRAARMRNWRIRNLRALHALCHHLTGERLARAQAAVDEELTLIGAETHEQRLARLEAE